MYDLAEKNKILKLFKKGESISNIRLQSNVSKSTLYRWKKTLEIVIEKSKQVKSLIEQEKLGEAEKLAKEILEINHDDLSARSQLITIYKKQGKWNEVERLANEILGIDSDDLPARSQLITIYKKQGKWNEVERLANEILEIDPDSLPAKAQLIIIYKNQQKWDEVERLASEILKIEPKNVQAKSQLIIIYQRQEKLDEAERLANEILEIKPKDVQARSQLITIYANQGKLSEVERLASEILEINPNDLLVRSQLTKIYTNQGKKVDPQSKPQQNNGIKRKADSKKEESKQNTIRSESINAFRKDIYDGKITLDNLSEYEEKISKLTPFEQKMLLAEAYTHWNLASNAVQLLKQASKLDGITDSQKKILSQAIQVAKATKMNPIARKKQWNSFSGSKEER